MDINLAAPIAANVTLVQPWYISIINAGVGALIGGALALLAVKITQRDSEKRDEQERKYDAHRAKREELKKIYTDLIFSVDKINTGNTRISQMDSDYLIRRLITITLLGSDNIKVKTGDLFQTHFIGRIEDLQEREKLVNRFYHEVVPLMIQELKDLEYAT